MFVDVTISIVHGRARVVILIIEIKPPRID